MEAKINADKELILAQTNQAATKSKEMEEALRKESERLERERQERERKKKEIQEIEKKLLHGSQIISEAKKEELELRKKTEALEQSRMEEERKKRALRQREEAQMEIAKKYDDQEVEVKKVTEKLKKVRDKYKEVKQEIDDVQAEFQQEREDMLETIRDLSRQLQLKEMILEHFVPHDSVEKVRVMMLSIVFAWSDVRWGRRETGWYTTKKPTNAS